MDVADAADDSTEATEKRRRTAFGEGDRSEEARDVIERERLKKYNRACAEREEILTAIEMIDRRNAAANLFFEVSTPPLTTTTQPLTHNLIHTNSIYCTERDRPYTLPPLPFHTYHNRLITLQPITHTFTHLRYTHTQVNAKIYVDEAMKLGTRMKVEIFEPVLDEEGDLVKNMVMYMVAESFGDLPLEVKWWTGRMGDNNVPIREAREMAIADWGDLHRNTPPQTQTQNKNTTHPNNEYTNTKHPTTKPTQTKVLPNTTHIKTTQTNNPA